MQKIDTNIFNKISADGVKCGTIICRFDQNCVNLKCIDHVNRT